MKLITLDAYQLYAMAFVGAIFYHFVFMLISMVFKK